MPSPAHVTEALTRTELWTSFASLLRSYCAAHGLNSPVQAVVEVSEHAITVRVVNRWLTLTEQNGTIVARRDHGAVAQFLLNPDGTLTAGAMTMEMDMVAEQLAREIFTI